MVPAWPTLANWGRQAGLSSIVGGGGRGVWKAGGWRGGVTGEGLHLGQWDIAHSS